MQTPRYFMYSEVMQSQASQLPHLISNVLGIFCRQKKPRTWRGFFMRGAYRPSSMALLRTAPLSALVANNA